jgi:hypothetical protein
MSRKKRIIGSRCISYVSPANPKNGVKASVCNESGQFRPKEIKGVYRGGGLR